MGTEDNKQLVERLFNEVIPGKNPGAIDQLISPQFAHHASFDEKPGLEGFKEIIKKFPHIKIIPDLELSA